MPPVEPLAPERPHAHRTKQTGPTPSPIPTFPECRHLSNANECDTRVASPPGRPPEGVRGAVQNPLGPLATVAKVMVTTSCIRLRDAFKWSTSMLPYTSKTPEPRNSSGDDRSASDVMSPRFKEDFLKDRSMQMTPASKAKPEPSVTSVKSEERFANCVQEQSGWKRFIIKSAHGLTSSVAAHTAALPAVINTQLRHMPSRVSYQRGTKVCRRWISSARRGLRTSAAVFLCSPCLLLGLLPIFQLLSLLFKGSSPISPSTASAVFP